MRSTIASQNHMEKVSRGAEGWAFVINFRDAGKGIANPGGEEKRPRGRGDRFPMRMRVGRSFDIEPRRD